MDAANQPRLAFEIATMPKAERENLTLVGHALGGRIVARVLAQCGKVWNGVVCAGDK